MAAYRQDFCRRFADLAPLAWASLCSHDDLAALYVDSPQGSPERWAIYRAFIDAARRWAAHWRLPEYWVAERGLVTLAHRAVNAKAGKQGAASLVSDVQVGFEEVDGAFNATWTEVDVVPALTITIDFSPHTIAWNPLVETAAQFRERVVSDYDGRVRGELAKIRDVTDPAPIGVIRHHVEWLILHRVVGVSVNELHHRYNVSRPAVDKGIALAAERLGVAPA